MLFFLHFSLISVCVRVCIQHKQNESIQFKKKNEWHLNENHTQNQQIIDNHTSGGGGGCGGDGDGKKFNFEWW